MRPPFIPRRRRSDWFATAVALVVATVIVFGAIYAAAAFIAMDLRPMSWQAARATLVVSFFVGWRWFRGAK